MIKPLNILNELHTNILPSNKLQENEQVDYISYILVNLKF